MYARTTLIATALLAATLTACGGGDHDQGKAERATAAPASSPSKAPDCGPDSSLSQADWMAQCSSASATPAADQPDTELAAGDTFAYKDGIKVKVTGFTTITKYGEYDSKPDADKLAFRVTWTVTNGTAKPYDLDGFGYNAEGATAGGETESIFVDADSKQMTGRLAPGRSGTFTAEYAIAKSDGTTVLFTMSRIDAAFLNDGSAVFGEDPHWTGTIK